MATLAAQFERPSPSAQPQQGLALTYHRLMLVMFLFVGVTFVVVARLAQLQLFTDHAGSALSVNPLLPPRGDIVDRNGLPLARTFDGWTIGVRPSEIIGDKREVARRLAELMPQRTAAQYFAILNDRRPFLYLARSAVPETIREVNALGEPGIVFEREPQRLYPQTALAGHVLGWVDRDGHGASGMEQVLEARLSDPAQRGQPVALSIDSRVQAVIEAEIANAVTMQNAEGGTGIVLDVRTGEVIAMASAPTFNPNSVSRSPARPAYNRATYGRYELGSVFKPITIAAAMEQGVVTSLHQRWDATAPVAVGRFRISDDHPLNRHITVAELMVHSSNIATARVADQMGAARMQAAFRALGFDRPAAIELPDARQPSWPADWGRATVLTSGFGHGVAITPLHLASAYAALVNGGILRPATLLKVEPGHAVPGRRVYSAQTSYRIRQLLRLVVLQGTGRRADAPGFRVGGKTGTAEKAGRGGYSNRVNVSTFAAAFPMDDPRYVVVVMMDAPQATEANSFVTTAAYTSAPIVSRVISRVGPLLNVIPSDSRDIDTAELMPPAGRDAGTLMNLGALTGSGETASITGFAIDHRKVAPGTVFGAFKGARVNGEDFIPDAVASGAIAVVSRPETAVAGAVHIPAAEPRQAFARLAAKFFAPFPETVIAVTGTNGKTSNVELCRQLWRMAGHPSASIGTLGVTTSDEQVTTGLTTPDIVTFLSNMAGLERMGITHAAFEASSHGLSQYRTEGLKVSAAAFTNLTRDHLDYHETMEAYFEAKMRLFEEVVAAGGTAVIWADDSKSVEVAARAQARGLKVMTVGTEGETLKLLARETTQLGQKLTIEAEGKTHVVTLGLIGAYQAANALTAAGLVIATGGDVARTLANLGRVQPVRGRLERAVISRAGAPVYVDYAHTPDAIEAACQALRPHARERLIIVLGAGGDRDTGKRAPMGEAAARLADKVIVTDDNPRTEDAAGIRRAILEGAPGAEEVPGRREAIRAAIAEAGAGDIVLLAGKGHEQGQIVGDRVLPFDDVSVAREEAA